MITAKSQPFTPAYQWGTRAGTAAKDYHKGVMNGKTTVPAKAWKTEYAKLTAKKKTLNQQYLAWKEEVKEAEKIRKSVYSILRQEQQPHRKQDMKR